jgi:hypothetical protein
MAGLVLAAVLILTVVVAKGAWDAEIRDREEACRRRGAQGYSLTRGCM